jgi:P27 family predicted phage terminase small subunit
MKTGRPPLPTAVKRLRGTLRSRQPGGADAVAGRAVDAADVADVRASRLGWLVRLLTSMHIITKVDGPVVLLAACRLTDYQELSRDLEVHGRTYSTTTSTGSTMYRQRGEVALRDAAWRDTMAALTQLGLTPSSRSRVGTVANPATPEGELEAYLSR